MNSVKDTAAYPHHIEDLRIRLMNQLFSLLESQSRTRSFASSISTLVKRLHGKGLEEFERGLARIDDPLTVEMFRNAITDFRNLDLAFDKLVDERQRQWYKNGKYLKQVIDELTETTDYLASILVEKSLLERQSQVLENIILSHEKVSQWKEFVQEILAGFHKIFPFNFFFIAFAEEHGLSLYFYYMGEYKEEEKRQVRIQLGQKMLRQLNLPKDVLLDIEEYQIPGHLRTADLSDIRMLTVPVPDHAYGLDGLLGVAYASVNTLTAQERTIIRSLLSVMVMVVGSSKVLSRTLSELEYYSVHDPLTGIHNRRYFNEMLEYEVGRSSRHHHQFAVLLLDLDDFKEINDTYGHPLGDEVLKKIAESITSHLRKGDIATRMGGDEFAVILPETPPEGAKIAAESIRANLESLAFKSPNGKDFHVTTSVGIVSYPRDMQTVEDLMSGVDVALYQAKGLGKNEVCEFDAAAHLKQIMRDSRSVAEELRRALREERIQPYFQPIVDCKSGEIFAYESIARLLETDGRVTVAGQFIETIEKYGMGRELDRIMVRKVIEANRQIIHSQGKPKRLFINLSAQEIQGRGILGYAEELCAQLEVPPSSIVFEILERDAISDITHMGKFLTNLRKKGFAFALDDFGSGYNSFHYLRELRFEYVKIDGAFVRNILNSKIDRALVHNLSRLCQELDILTIGEFVESQEIFDLLKDMGINFGQGFHIGLPLNTL
ncbi:MULTISPECIES: putative bifunctional diguanylate cyclase/phosphodiesterase [Methylomicrobium]|uniref:Diguanylate cyclase (GGDEF) domain-containing protein n=1 Tax=Methylomicrobium album BG8 TaxID=686340 RepID=H8GJU3_METAL|nr:MULTISPECIES: bifunctional diguanylate cyclase/phosphodiesterase [Methylomicrobium]EIC27902.1 diguanylate cyclase (GGDEF) domain-containing protein [Methylomicrobium album BG8]